MGGRLDISAADCKGKPRVNGLAERIIPLQSLAAGGDSPCPDMPLKTLMKSPSLVAFFLFTLGAFALLGQEPAKEAKPAAGEAKPGVFEKPAEEKKPDPPKVEAKPADKEAPAAIAEKPTVDPDDEAALEEAEAAVVAKPVPADPVQVYGWREKILIDGMKEKIYAKLDTGAYTSSIHAEEKELFEREGKKWVRFTVTEPGKKDSPRVKIEAPLVRIARIKNPGGDSETREVVRLAFKIGDRKLRGDFTLNNRSNMLSAVLIGRKAIKELGWIDPSRTNLADDKVMR